ncbi:MAG TPA: hypothetical protein VF194_09365 [Ferrovibrio sp.]|uniref:hypothetical protein n=1 Tax=Ferrovibrio sp. TaxID=1917215 RepID=UPI002ED66ED7
MRRLIIAAISGTLLVAPLVQPAAAKPVAELPEATSAMPYRSPGKPSHPISVDVVMDAPLKAGTESTGRLSIHSALPLRSLDVLLKPEAGLTVLSNGLMEKRVNGVAANKAVTMPLKVTPGSDAARELRVVIRAVKENGTVVTREAGLLLGDEPKKHSKVLREEGTQAATGVQDQDAVMKAEQEITRH